MPIEEKKRSLYEAMEKITGIPVSEQKSILQTVLDNSARLAKCVGPHDFVKVPGDNPLRDKFVCSLCHGEVNHERYAWYLKGLEHGRLPQ